MKEVQNQTLVKEVKELVRYKNYKVHDAVSKVLRSHQIIYNPRRFRILCNLVEYDLNLPTPTQVVEGRRLWYLAAN